MTDKPALAAGIGSPPSDSAAAHTRTMLWILLVVYIFNFLDRQIVNILAEPNLVAVSGETASFLAGGEFPIPVPQGNQQVTIQFREFGVRLNFTPVVMGQQMIRLRVAPEVSELDFTAALTERVARLKGLEVDALDRARARMRLTPGARTFVRTLKRLGYTVGIVSGGFTHFTDGLAAELGVDHARANQLEVHDGRLTGRVVGEVVDRGAKARFLRSFAEAEGIPLSQTVAVGDGANDLDMLATAGLGVAFNAKPVVQEAADTTVNVPYLDAILFVLGVTRDEVERADTDTG